jgi:hypothetical protein
MASNQPDPRVFLSFKNGSLGASHTHLDLNHINVGIGDTMMLVELGSRPYPADYFSAKRYSYYEIGTPGHNSVLVGGRGQARGKVGKLVGPVESRNVTTLVGIADGAYEVDTSRARRHVAFVDKGFWVLLDEIETPQPQAVELRFHTYGSVESRAPGRWQITDSSRVLDVRTPEGLTVTTETPDGWIRPVRVLSAKAAELATARTLVTVLQPLATGANARGVRVDQAGDRITVTVGSSRVQWRRTPDGWQLAGS